MWGISPSAAGGTLSQSAKHQCHHATEPAAAKSLHAMTHLTAKCLHAMPCTPLHLAARHGRIGIGLALVEILAQGSLDEVCASVSMPVHERSIVVPDISRFELTPTGKTYNSKLTNWSHPI